VTPGVLSAWLVVAAGVLAFWLFWIKVRPPRYHVPSLLVWRRVFAETRVPTWWERVRRAVSCALTVLIAVALAAAVARPDWRASAHVSRTLIVLDSSWSMAAASPGGGTRWMHAIAGAAMLARSSGGEVIIASTASGIELGPTTDIRLVEDILTRLAPLAGDDGRWPVVAGGGAVHFFTDGAVPRTLDPAVVVHSVFEPVPNVAVTAFEARRATSVAASAEAYVEIANFADADQPVHLTITRDTTVLVDRWIEMRAGELVREVIPLDAIGGPRLRAQVSADGNALAIDDEAAAWVVEADPIEVLLVSDAPEALVAVIGRDPAVRLRLTSTSGYVPAEVADLVVFDRWLPPGPASQPMLAIAPPSATWLGSAGRAEDAVGWAPTQAHPILEGVEPVMLDLVGGRGYEAAEVAVIASSDRGAPVVGIQDREDRRLVLLNFPIDAALGGAPALPVLVGNAIEWLARPFHGAARPPGPVALPSSTSRIVSPNGQAVQLVRAAGRVQATLTSPGLYLVSAAGSESVLPVNAGRTDLSDLTQSTFSPRDGLVAAPTASSRSWWVYSVLLALALLTVEWWTWQRRITV